MTDNRQQQEQQTSVSHPSTSVIHLGGHPLPPLIELPSTSTSSEGGYIDLFLLSLQRPVLLFVYPDPKVLTDKEEIQKTQNQFKQIQETFESFNKIEKDIEIFGLSTQSHKDQLLFAEQNKLEKIHFLSDFKFQFTNSLELPKLILPSKNQEEQITLQRITLLLREGQITQFQFPILQPGLAAQESFKLLNAGKNN